MSTPEKSVQDAIIEADESLAEPHKFAHYGRLITAYITNSKYSYLTTVGLFILLLTFAMGSVALVMKMVAKEDTAMLARLAQLKVEQESHRRAMILDKMLLEYENVCKDLQIFAQVESSDETDDDDDDDDDELMAQTNDVEANDSELSDEAVNSVDTNENLNVKSKPSKGKHGNGHSSRHNNNRSAKVKTGKKLENTKKEQQPIKKNTTAEPIIYLFALVFIYLLLKAASDINQHYKSQAKGDKRLRRCSLQSYAQTHKQDRRASKDSPIKQKLRLMETRSQSVDRYTLPMSEIAARKTEILSNLRKYTSVDGQQQRYPRWHAVIDNHGAKIAPAFRGGSGELFVKTLANRAENLSSSNANDRRCSVPVSLNYQGQKLNATPLVPITAIGRRTSIAGGHIGAIGVSANDTFNANMDYMDPQFNEVKRRVRMINRH